EPRQSRADRLVADTMWAVGSLGGESHYTPSPEFEIGEYVDFKEEEDGQKVRAQVIRYRFTSTGYVASMGYIVKLSNGKVIEAEREQLSGPDLHDMETSDSRKRRVISST
ncbi:uncharacterized protein PV09_09851, partial [Verruconis gallopava]